MAAAPEARTEMPVKTGIPGDQDTVSTAEAASRNQKFENTGSRVASDSPLLPELNPDYAIVVKVDGEKDTDNISKLVKALLDNGVYSQVRQGNPGTALVLAKCSDKRVIQQNSSGRLRDWLNGVTVDVPEVEGSSDEGPVSPAERLRLVYDVLTESPSRSGIGLTPGYGEWSFIEQIFPLHNYKLNQSLLKRWSTKLVINDQDIGTIRAQFGDKVALYFAFLQFYFWWGLAPTVAGLSFHYLIGDYSTVFATLNLLWGICFLFGWSRRQEQLAIRWGNKNSSKLTKRRPTFQPQSEVIDQVTGERKPFYSPFKRTLKRLAFVPVYGMCALVLVACQCLMFVFEIFLAQVYSGPFKEYLQYLPIGLLAAIVPFLTAIYTVVVRRMTEWENHETEDSYEVAFTQKMFAFNFLTTFMNPFLTAFIYLPFGHLIFHNLDVIGNFAAKVTGRPVSITDNFQLNRHRLHQQVVYLIGTAQVVSFALETIVPYIQHKVTSRAKKYTTGELKFDDAPEEAEFLKEVRSQATLPVYNVQEDYRQLVVQFGCTILFGPVWSLTPVAASINNFVQLRGDAAKICLDTQRPIPERAENIGPWTQSLTLLTWLGSLVSSSIIAMFGRSLHGGVQTYSGERLVLNDTWEILFVVIAAEHMFLLLFFSLRGAFSRMESKEHIQAKKSLFQGRQKYYETFSKELAPAHVTQDPGEKEWASITDSELSKQIKRSVVEAKPDEPKKTK